MQNPTLSRSTYRPGLVQHPSRYNQSNLIPSDQMIAISNPRQAKHPKQAPATMVKSSTINDTPHRSVLDVIQCFFVASNKTFVKIAN
ncbi:MAG: hypothetical protein A2029_01765 [Chloroflexi bacterium RBG_19FT_COMBO_47_9]|nr:MAG: hypothetical protein A2029_01765 [Chloroflexi bacterium RBG_19FT_COMBO_47_9]